MEHTINLIIPIYNSDYIQKQLFSIQNLEKVDYKLEIVYIDDGSSKKYKEKYKNLFNNFSNLNIVYHSLWEKNWQNRVCFARNKWAELATSEELIFIDQETILHKNYLLNLSKYFSWEIIILWPYLWYNNFEKQINDEDINHFIKTGIINKENFEDFRINSYKSSQIGWKIWRIFCASNFFIRKEIYKKIWWFDENITIWGDEDVEFGYRLFKAWYEIYFDENIKVLNLSRKLYKKPYNILEKDKIPELSENWYKNIKKHKTNEYINYVVNRYTHLPEDYKPLISKNLKKLLIWLNIIS